MVFVAYPLQTGFNVGSRRILLCNIYDGNKRYEQFFVGGLSLPADQAILTPITKLSLSWLHSCRETNYSVEYRCACIVAVETVKQPYAEATGIE